MAAIRLPIELLALNKEFNAAIKNSTANVKSLDAQVKITNESIKNTAQNQTIKSTKTLSDNVASLGKSYEQSSGLIKTATNNNVSSFKRLEAATQVVAKNFRLIRDVILPLGLAFFATGKILNKFRISTIFAVIDLRIEIVKSIFLIKKELFDLSKSRSLVEFVANLEQSEQRISQSFDGILESSKRVGSTISDPSLFADFSNFISRATVSAAAFGVVLKGIGKVFLGTSDLTLILARSTKLIGSIFTIGALQAELFAANLAAGSGRIATFARLLQPLLTGITNFTAQFVRFGNVVERSGSILVGLNQTSLRPFSKFIRDSLRGVSQFSDGLQASIKQTELFSKGIFGTTSRITVFGTGLIGLSLLLQRSENSFIRFLGEVGEFVGLLLGPVGLLVSNIITAVGGYVEAIGTKFVQANQKAAESFQKAELRAFVFERTINAFSEVFPDVVGSTAEWNQEIQKLNQTTGETTGNLQFIVTELVAAGSELGLSREQLKLLTRASVDFAAQIKGDSTQAVLDLISGLNGNSQSVQKYGLQLSAASVQQKLFDKGITRTFESMTEQEKIQARLIALTSKYNIVQGLAEEQTSTFEGTAKLFNQRLSGLITLYGQGANVIENFNIGQKVSISIFEQLNPFVVQATGFFGALFARILQITGSFLKLAFTIAFLNTSIKALNTLLASTGFQRGLFAKLPFINSSFADLIKSFGVTNFQLKNLGDVAKVVGQIFVQQAKRIIAASLGIEAATLSLQTAMAGLGQRVLAFGRILALVAFNPVTLKILALVVVAKVLIETFRLIERETGLVSKTFNEIKGAFQPILDLFKEGSVVLEAFKTIFTQVFGSLVFLATKSFAGILLLVSLLPTAVLSADKKIKFEQAGNQLNLLSEKIALADNDLSKIGQTAALASKDVNNALSKFGASTLPEELKNLQGELERAGQTEIKRLQIQRNQRLEIIKKNLEEQKVSEQQALLLNVQVEEAFRREREALELAHRQKLAQVASEFGGAEAIAILKAQELEQLMLAFEAELLTREQFEVAKQVIEAQFEEQRINRIIENEKTLADFKRQNLSNSLTFEKKILEEQLANEKLSVEQRKVLLKKIQDNEKQQTAQRLNQADGFFGDLATLQQTGSRKLFEIGKAASLAQAIVQGYVAVQNALAVQPYPVGVALAVGAAIKAAVQVAAIRRQGFQQGITQVPPGFPNDSFPANLTSGERVVTAGQNKDLTRFLSRNDQPSGDDETKQILKDGFTSLVSSVVQMSERLDNLENQIVVNVGNKEIIREVREGLRSGRSIAV